jgi:hypothetical protein
LTGTGYVIFQDVLDGAHLTTGHVLTGLALLIATVAGHQITPTFHAKRYALTLSMLILAVGAVTYIGLLSGSRNAEQIAIKAERIEAANTQRKVIIAERATAMEMLDAAKKAVASECASGEGTRCRGRQATAKVYEAAVAGHDAKLEALGPPLTANAGYKAAAEGIVLLPWFHDAKVAEVEHMLVVLLPWLATLLAELSVPAFLSLALGHETVAAVVEPATVAGPPPGGPGKRRRLPATDVLRQLPTNVILLADKRSDIVSALEAAGRRS